MEGCGGRASIRVRNSRPMGDACYSTVLHARSTVMIDAHALPEGFGTHCNDLPTRDKQSLLGVRKSCAYGELVRVKESMVGQRTGGRSNEKQER